MKKFFVLSSVVAALMASGSAFAATSPVTSPVTSQFNVTVRILPVCEVSANSTATVNADAWAAEAGADIDFGDYESNHAAIVDALSHAGANGAIGVRCTKGTPFAIGLTTTNEGKTDGTGRMNPVAGGTADGSGDTVAYKLYQDSGRTKAWGNDEGSNRMNNNPVGGGTLVGTGMNVGNTQFFPVYGRIEAGELDKTAGRYKDVVTVSVHY